MERVNLSEKNISFHKHKSRILIELDFDELQALIPVSEQRAVEKCTVCTTADTAVRRHFPGRPGRRRTARQNQTAGALLRFHPQ